MARTLYEALMQNPPKKPMPSIEGEELSIDGAAATELPVEEPTNPAEPDPEKAKRIKKILEQLRGMRPDSNNSLKGE